MEYYGLILLVASTSADTLKTGNNPIFTDTNRPTHCSSFLPQTIPRRCELTSRTCNKQPSRLVYLLCVCGLHVFRAVPRSKCRQRANGTRFFGPFGRSPRRVLISRRAEDVTSRIHPACRLPAQLFANSQIHSHANV